MAEQVLVHNLSELLDGARRAKVDIHAGTGNLTVDKLADGEQLLASGTLEYVLKEGPPRKSVTRSDDAATLLIHGKGGAKGWLRLPWSACNAATNWQIHLNPAVACDLTAQSGGGNVKLDLSGAAITQLSADTGGGNVDLALPDGAHALCATAKTGAGNVTVDVGARMTGTNILDARSGAGDVVVRIPAGMPARIHATSGMGKKLIDARFGQLDAATYQSPDYDGASDKIEITINSGAGNVIVNTK